MSDDYCSTLKNAKFPIITAFKNPTNIFIAIGVAVLCFDLSYYIMTHFMKADYQGFQCSDPTPPTLKEMGFPALMSLLMAVYVIGVKETWKKKCHSMASDTASVSLLGIGGILGSLTLFCPICTFGVVSVFGLSLGMEAFGTFAPHLRWISLVLLLVGLALLNHQLANKSCSVCDVFRKSRK